MRTSGKKNFKGTDNPALSFITPIDNDGEHTHNAHYAYNTVETHNTDNTHNTHNEKKSKRLNLLLPPSLHLEIVDIAWKNRVSTNELIVQILRDYVKE